jgi:hypothetical protein
MPEFQTTAQLTEQFRTIMRHRPAFVPKNVKTYKFRRIALVGDRGAFGLQFSPEPQTGQIVHVDASLVVLKSSPAQYAIVDPALFAPEQIPIMGARVTLAPYVRKSLEDFLPVDAPRPNGPGFMLSILGETKTRLPGKPAKGYLHDMANQLEQLTMPDGVRYITNAFADWRAHDFQWINDDSTIDYRLMFKIVSPGYTGPITIRYNRGADTYEIITVDAASEPVVRNDVHFDELGNVLSDIARDDDSWFHIQVTYPSASRRAA